MKKIYIFPTNLKNYTISIKNYSQMEFSNGSNWKCNNCIKNWKKKKKRFFKNMVPVTVHP